MTTRIEIKNPRDNKHSINVWKNEDHVAQLPPGDHITLYIWEGINCIIKEVPNAGIST